MLIILGVAGSGKSTQSQLLAARDGFVWVSMGELLRSVITDDRREQMLAGKVLDEREVTEILNDELIKRGDIPELIIDGFPRGVLQAEWLLAQREARRFDIRAVIQLHARPEAVKERLLARGRQDDTEAAIEERFHEYEHTIKPIIATMSESGIAVVMINAEQSPDDVAEEIKTRLAEVDVIV